jgi:hypothetical protein
LLLRTDVDVCAVAGDDAVADRRGSGVAGPSRLDRGLLNANFAKVVSPAAVDAAGTTSSAFPNDWIMVERMTLSP